MELEDPICGMHVSEELAVATRVVDACLYAFCPPRCIKSYDDQATQGDHCG